MNTKATYVKPELKAHGSVEEVTQAATNGHLYDGNLKFGDPLTTPHAMS